MGCWMRPLRLKDFLLEEARSVQRVFFGRSVPSEFVRLTAAPALSAQGFCVLVIAGLSFCCTLAFSNLR